MTDPETPGDPRAAAHARRKLASDFGPVEVWMAFPVEDGESGDHRCDYGIKGPLTDRRGHVFGIDAFQALQLCLERIGTDLMFCDEGQRGTLRWLDAAGQTGFPLPSSLAGSGTTGSGGIGEGEPPRRR